MVTGVKVPVEGCGVCGRIDDGVRADVEEVIEDDLIESGIGVGASGAGGRGVGVDDVGGIEVLNVKVPVSVIGRRFDRDQRFLGGC